MKKRLLGGLLAASAVFALASCGNEVTPEPVTPPAEPTPSEDSTPSNTTKSWQDNHVDDSYDQLATEAILYYSQHGLKDGLESLTDFTQGFWKIITVNAAIENGFSKSYFNYDSLQQAYKDSVNNADVTNLPAASSYSSDANYAKYYYAARAIGKTDLDAYKTSYTAYLDSKTQYNEYDEYTYPFTISIAKALGVDSHVNDGIKNTTYRVAKNGAWGVNAPEGLAWQLTGMSLYKDLTATDVEALTMTWVTDYEANYGVPEVSLSSYLIAYAALDLNPRTESFDIVKTLFDNYYDTETHQFDVEKLGAYDYSSEQIYAALIAYVSCKDNKKAVNLFA